MRPRRLELPCLSALEPQAGVSTTSTKAANHFIRFHNISWHFNGYFGGFCLKTARNIRKYHKVLQDIMAFHGVSVKYLQKVSNKYQTGQKSVKQVSNKNVVNPENFLYVVYKPEPLKRILM